jgi:hypothetical protein
MATQTVNLIPPAPASTAWPRVAADHVARVEVVVVMGAAMAVAAVTAVVVVALSAAEKHQRSKAWSL